jgi:hypothetical protein
MTTRRSFLKAGLVGGGLLAAGGLAAVALGRDATRDRETVLRALVPVLLDGALPDTPEEREAAVARCVQGVGTAVAGLAPAAQAEAAQLFALLAMPPTRWALAGVGSGWADASAHEVAAFLNRWRTHRLALLQSGYHGLHDLVLGAWYGDERSWREIGYGGPLNL